MINHKKTKSSRFGQSAQYSKDQTACLYKRDVESSAVPTIKQFNNAANSFLKKNNFKDFADLCEQTKKKGPAWHNFFVIPIIRAYLTRPFEDAIMINKEHPNYSNIERQINNELGLSYRGRDKETFYQRGTSPDTSNLLRIRLSEKIRCDKKKYPNTFKGVVVVHTYQKNMTIKTIGIILKKIENSKNGESTIFDNNKSESICIEHKEPYTFIIFPTSAPEHIFTTLAVIDNHTKRLNSFLIFNSSDNHEYNLEREALFNKGYRKSNINLINCNLDIQKHPQDGNCGIYSYKITKALVRLLKDPNSDFRKKLIALGSQNNSASTNKVFLPPLAFMLLCHCWHPIYHPHRIAFPT